MHLYSLVSIPNIWTLPSLQNMQCSPVQNTKLPSTTVIISLAEKSKLHWHNLFMLYSASGYALTKRLVCRQTVGYGCYFYPLLRSSLFSDVTRVNQQLPTFRDILAVPSSRVLSHRCFGTAYRTRCSDLLFNNSVRHTYSVYKEEYHHFFHIWKMSKYSLVNCFIQQLIYFLLMGQ